MTGPSPPESGASPLPPVSSALLRLSLALFLLSFVIDGVIFVFQLPPPNTVSITVALAAGLGSGVTAMGGLFVGRGVIPGWLQLLGWLAACGVSGVVVAFVWVLVLVSGLPAAG